VIAQPDAAIGACRPPVTCGTMTRMPNTATRRPGRPPAAKSAETRERILNAAREVFSELGYDAATFQAIAVRADLTRPAINHYFDNKRLLYREVLEQTRNSVVRAGVARAKGETTLLGRLSAFFAAAMDIGSENRSAAAFLVTSVLESQRHPDLSTDTHDPLETSRRYLTWAVNDAVEHGELRADSDVPAIVEMLLAVMWGMGFYAGYVGTREDLGPIIEKLELLLANKLWRLPD